MKAAFAAAPVDIQAALAQCGAPALEALAKDLPIVGAGPKPPLPSEPWPQLAEVEAYLARQAPALEQSQQALDIAIEIEHHQMTWL